MNKKIGALLTLPIATFALSSCSNASSTNNGHSATVKNSQTATKSKAPEAIVTTTNTKVVASDLNENPIDVNVKNGSLKNITIDGKDNENYTINKIANNHWQIKGILTPYAHYSLKVTTINGDNVEKTQTTAITPTKTGTPTGPSIFPYGDQTVGVGMPITVTFKHSVANRAQVEKNIKMEMSTKVDGSWGWLDDKTVVWKPNSFWPTGEKVKYTVNVKGLDLGYGYTGNSNLIGSFKVGRKWEIKVSNAKKDLTVYENGKAIKTMPVSLGKPGHLTSSGTNIIYEKQSPVEMKGADYDEIVYYAQRYTSMGEYIHSAPWSVGDQGYVNVSHGCVNISPDNAIWMWKKTLLGDVVNITGTGKKAQTWDGMGAIWNYTPKEWKALDAIK